MKIASKIKPRSGQPRRVDVHGRRYVFAPTLDRNEEIHFVCDVKNEQAAETLITSGDYYPFGVELEPVASLQRGALTVDHATSDSSTPIAPLAPVAPVAPSPAAQGDQDGGGDAGANPSAVDTANTSAWPAEIAAEATELLKGSATEISTNVGKVSHTDVVKVALDLEAKAEKPRANVQKLLETTLQGIIAAKVGG